MEQQMQDSFEFSRYGKFTASEISKLLKSGRGKDELFGDTAKTYINEKIAECLTGESKPSIKSVATDWGLENERDAVLFFEMITGKSVHHYGVGEYKFFTYKNIGGCSPDGIIESENANIQVKCPFLVANMIPYLLIKGDRQQWLKKNEPDYYAQCQFEMMCCGTNKCYFVVYAGAERMIEHFHRMVVIELLPDEELQKELDMRITAAAKILYEAIQELRTPDIIYSLNQQS